MTFRVNSISRPQVLNSQNSKKLNSKHQNGKPAEMNSWKTVSRWGAGLGVPVLFAVGSCSSQPHQALESRQGPPQSSPVPSAQVTKSPETQSSSGQLVQAAQTQPTQSLASASPPPIELVAPITPNPEGAYNFCVGLGHKLQIDYLSRFESLNVQNSEPGNRRAQLIDYFGICASYLSELPKDQKEQVYKA
ncbi:MAG: hypothetical protein SFU25_03610, partial [Candidatus Caenarcaniphilales bacterium]|nr:hypothetical protein [Candidatus Caenarcaniphilales bacterium]